MQCESEKTIKTIKSPLYIITGEQTFDFTAPVKQIDQHNNQQISEFKNFCTPIVHAKCTGRTKNK